MSTKMKRQRGEKRDGVQPCCLRTTNLGKEAGMRLEVQRRNGERKIEARVMVLLEGLWLLRADGAGDSV